MKVAALLAAFVGALLALPAASEIRPTPGRGDPRIQTVMYDPDQIVLLQIASGFQLTLEFAPDERIENVAVGDSGAWLVSPNKRGDHLFIKVVQTGVTTNLTVITDARTYIFELSTAASGVAAYTVRFQYPQPAASASAETPSGMPGRYKLSGTPVLRPDAISDDGNKTYMIWLPDQTMPAVFVIDREGKEAPADGAMRDGRYVLDSVNNRVIFRLDKQTATAERVPQVNR